MDPMFSKTSGLYGPLFQQAEEKATSQAEPTSNQQQIESISDQQANVTVEEKTQKIAFNQIIHEEDLLDPIEQNFMRKPVVLPCCGISVDESSLEKWFAKTRKRNCYSCQKDCGKGPFAINLFLKNAIEDYKKVAKIEDEEVETKIYHSDNQSSSIKTTLSLEEIQAQIQDIRSISKSGVEGVALAIEMLQSLEEQYPEEEAFSKLRKELQALSGNEALKRLKDIQAIGQQGKEGRVLAKEMFKVLKQDFPNNKYISSLNEESLVKLWSSPALNLPQVMAKMPTPINSGPLNSSGMPNMPNTTLMQPMPNGKRTIGLSSHDKPLLSTYGTPMTFSNLNTKPPVPNNTLPQPVTYGVPMSSPYNKPPVPNNTLPQPVTYGVPMSSPYNKPPVPNNTLPQPIPYSVPMSSPYNKPPMPNNTLPQPMINGIPVSSLNNNPFVPPNSTKMQMQAIPQATLVNQLASPISNSNSATFKRKRENALPVKEKKQEEEQKVLKNEKESDVKKLSEKTQEVFELAKTGDIKFFKEAITNSLHAVDGEGNTLLHAVVLAERSVKFIDLLVKRGLSVNVIGPRGSTPLHLAASLKSTYQVKKLLALGADSSIQNSDGKTPIQMTKSKKIKQIFTEKEEKGIQSKEKDPMEINSHFSPNETD